MNAVSSHSPDSCDDYAAVARRGEVITDSALSRSFTWPERDPTQGVYQPERLHDDEMTTIVREASSTRRFNWERFNQLHRDADTAEKILELVNHRGFQFNSRKAFRDPPSMWRARIEAAVREHRPLDIVLPCFCVISNPVKRFDATQVTAAEDITLVHLAYLARYATMLHGPGMVIHIVSDSTFYSPVFGVTSVEAQSYITRLRDRITDLGLDEWLRMHDMSDLLANVMFEFQDRFDAWVRLLSTDPCADGISPAEHERWLASMMASINTRKLGLPYAELRAILGDRSPTGPHAESVALRARWALNEYRAIKLAATDLQWEEVTFPGAIRATIHTKPIPVLGLRIYPEYKFSSQLLPYHGIGVVAYSTKSKTYKMTIEPEMFVYGTENATRVVDQHGHTSFYLRSPTRPV